MSLKVTSIAAAAVFALGFVAMGAAPLRAMDEETITTPDVAPPAPACSSGQIFDTTKNSCVAASTVVSCDKGFTYDAGKKACVKSTALNDEQLYNQGRMLALAGHYTDAIDTLGYVGNQNSNVLTMIGYSTRKLGDLQQGIAIYYKALALDPNNVNTHEYLGEGYLAAGRVDLAENELDKLQTICGVGCVQYQNLNRAILGDAVWTD
jgi:tetratricopeptide (TPR) repeat protein